MSALTFTLKTTPNQRVDLSPLVADKLQDLSLADIAALTLQTGRFKLRVDALFSIEGSDCQNIIIKNSMNKLDYIGREMTCGKITVEGDAGAYLGLSMKSGEIRVSGSTSIYAAGEMKNGFIEISQNAGDFLGAALPGNKNGMKGGIVVVKGNVGERCGDHLRRGVILVEGNAGDYCGSRMGAGTIAVMGQAGRFVGYAMKRGTLLLWNQPEISASFNDCGSHTLAFLPILFASFKTLNSKFADSSLAFNRIQRYAGDMSELGRGEILIRLG
jgi:formylmethanofuran dehydrogenase subunit C